MMKRTITIIISLVFSLFFHSCKTSIGTEEPQELVEVNFSTVLPEDFHELRAVLGDDSNSAMGGMTNVDMAHRYDLRYRIAIYMIPESGAPVRVVGPVTKTHDLAESTTFALRLIPNRSYKAVLWADFVLQGQTDDLHYNTQSLPEITLKDTSNTELLNDESRDAYFAVTDVIKVKTVGISQSLVLKRPFAKLRVVTTDWDPAAPKVNKVKITYQGCKRFTSTNLFSGESTSIDVPSDSDKAYSGVLNKTEKEYALGYDLSDKNRTIAVEYLIAPKTGQVPISAIVETYEDATLLARHTLKNPMPIQRNWVTTLLGNFLTNP